VSIQPLRHISRTIAGASCLSLASLSLAPTAAAQAGLASAERGPDAIAPEPADRPEVEKLVTRAITLRAEGKDAEALQVLKKAEGIDPDSVRVQVHLATVYQALGDWLLADQFLTLALAQENHPYVLRHRKALDDAARVIGNNIGRVAVEGGPPGAEVRLNGKLVGTLPIASPVRVTVGSYTLEVRLAGHYTARRPITVAGHGFVRESIQLEPLPADDTAEQRASKEPSGAGTAVDPSSERGWLTWTLAGLGVAAGVTTIGAVLYREEHAHRWNDNSRCLDIVGVSRAQQCGAERDKVDTGQNVAIGAGIATGLFASAALLNAFVFSDGSREQPLGLSLLRSWASPSTGLPNRQDGESGAGSRSATLGCSIGIAGASCFGSF
jgi:hypothetical protein